MTEISAELVKTLREMTGAPMMDCKRALQDADGDLEAAKQLLRERGMAQASKRAGRETTEGIVAGAHRRLRRARSSRSAPRPSPSPRTRSSARSPSACSTRSRHDGPDARRRARGRTCRARRASSARTSPSAAPARFESSERRSPRRLRSPAGEQDRRARARSRAPPDAARRLAMHIAVRRSPLRHARRGSRKRRSRASARSTRKLPRGRVQAGAGATEDRRGHAREALLRRNRCSPEQALSTSRRRPSPRLSRRKGSKVLEFER